MERIVKSAEEMEALGARIAEACLQTQGTLIFLEGDLGAGKTTLARGLLRRLGYQGNVKSPTYTLVESYELRGWRIYHLDLYRLHDPEELEYLGIRDFFAPQTICLIEWPMKGADRLLTADLTVQIDYLPQGRRVNIHKLTLAGEKVADLVLS